MNIKITRNHLYALVNLACWRARLGEQERKWILQSVSDKDRVAFGAWTIHEQGELVCCCPVQGAGMRGDELANDLPAEFDMLIWEQYGLRVASAGVLECT